MRLRQLDIINCFPPPSRDERLYDEHIAQEDE